MTYKELSNHVASQLPETQRRKYISTLNRFMRIFNQTDNDLVYTWLAPEKFVPPEGSAGTFAKFREKVLIEVDKKAEWEIASQMKRIFEFYRTSHDTEAILNSGQPFGHILRQLILRSYRSINHFQTETGIQVTNYLWLKGKCVPKTLGRVRELEQALKLKADDLLRVTPLALINDYRLTKVVNGREIKSDYKSERQGVLQDMSYKAQMNQLPKKVQDQLKALRQNKVVDKADWKKATYDAFVCQMLFFFGFLTLPSTSEQKELRGAGYRYSDLHLGMVLDEVLVDKYRIFLLYRAYQSNVPPKINATQTFRNFLKYSSVILRPGRGYIYLNHEMFAHDVLGPMANEENWKTKVRERWDKVFADLYDLKVPRSDKFTSIKAILDRPRPLDEIYEMIAAMEKDVEIIKINVAQRASHLISNLKLAMALAAILSVHPMRERNLREMDLGKNLYKRPGDEGWWMRFTEEELKNSGSYAVKGGIDVELDWRDGTGKKEIWASKYIDEYINNYRPHRLYAERCDRLFLANVATPSSSFKGFMENGMDITGFLYRMTKRYMPSHLEVGTQQWRHIAATHYVKNDPTHGEQRAADALFDTIQVIRHRYGQKTSKTRNDNVLKARHEAHKANIIDRAERKLIDPIAHLPSIEGSLAQQYINDEGIEELMEIYEQMGEEEFREYVGNDLPSKEVFKVVTRVKAKCKGRRAADET